METDACRNVVSMDWLAIMQAWQALPPEKRREQAWAQIPASVAASMAFEGEPVNQSWLEELHRRIEIPASSSPVPRVPATGPATSGLVRIRSPRTQSALSDSTNKKPAPNVGCTATG